MLAFIVEQDVEGVREMRHRGRGGTGGSGGAVEGQSCCEIWS
jgi:hypothetical protein